MELGLAGKTALITGGSAGIGLACAKTLICEGVNVAIASRSHERLAGAKTELEGLGIDADVATIAADLTQAADVERTVSEARNALGQIDILINSAGSARGAKFFDLADEAYLDAWNLKVLGYIRMTRAVAREMVERGDGRIVNIIGGAGRTPSPEFLNGSTANAALV